MLTPAKQEPTYQVQDSKCTEVQKIKRESVSQDAEQMRVPKSAIQSSANNRKETAVDTDCNLPLSENDNRLLFTYKSPYFGESIDITMSERVIACHNIDSRGDWLMVK